MSDHPKRLIEVDLPIKKISAHARREKSIRHGHISTLHIWWARRPLAACRAVLCAALWPDPADPLCPQKFRDDACRVVNEFAAKAASDKALAQSCSHDSWRKWQALAKTGGGLDASKKPHWNVLRFALLDFIADFADWDNSTVTEYLESARSLTQSAHESLGGAPGTRPLVFDPFAGGGSIPLEAVRVGADAFASDLNPVAVLLNKAILEYIPKYGQRLIEELRKWGEFIKTRAEETLAEFYPKDSDGAVPITYIWARTIRCDGPGCGFTVPLIRTAKLTTDEGLSLEPDDVALTFRVRIVGPQSPAQQPTIKGGSVTCPHCGYTNPAPRVRRQLAEKRGGVRDAQLLAVQVEKLSRRWFRAPVPGDTNAVDRAAERIDWELPHQEINPTRPYKNTRGVSAVTRIGVKEFSDLYNPRQALCMGTFLRLVAEAAETIPMSYDIRLPTVTLLGLAIGPLIHRNCSLSKWDNSGNRYSVTGTFRKQALPITWDYAETAPLADGSGSWEGSINWVTKVIERNESLNAVGTAVRSPAQACPLPNDSAAALFTDPPYFAAIPYADLSNFFYVWLRPLFRPLYPELFDTPLVEQSLEAIVTNANAGPGGEVKDDQFFKDQMRVSLDRAREIVNRSGIGVVVFADTRTESWEAILGAVVEAGWTITASWPIDTELQNRTQARGAASLQSSVHLVCRPRDVEAGSTDIGDWRDVLGELPRRIHEWMPRLQSEGVVGADAIFACLGPALEIFSRHSRVEKPSGDQVTLKEYLEYVWAAVSKEAISMIFEGADTAGFEEDARLTAMWLWTLNSGPSNGEAAEAGDTDDSDEESEEKLAKVGKLSGFTLEYDAARKIAQGLGAHLEHLVNLVEVRGETARLLPVAERTKALFGKEGTESPATKRKKSAQLSLPGMLEELEQEESGWTLQNAAKPGTTTLDRLHQAMILFAAGRGEGLRRFLVDDGAGKDQRFWRLAQALCALYPTGTDERRWSEGVLARKKGLGL